MPESFLLYLAFGCLAGLSSGLFGIGGGVIIVPFLVWLFTEQGFPSDAVMIMAVATSLATIVFTSMSAVCAHHRMHAVDWSAVRRLSPGILIGSIVGSIVANQLPVVLFKLIFAMFLVFVALRMLLAGSAGSQQTLRPGTGLLSLAGLLIGSVSAILGIGGGTLSVPLLIRCRFPIRNAVAISSACGFPIAVAGSASYVVLGWNHSALPTGSLGYIYLPALVGIVASSFVFAPLGAKLAHWLPAGKLKRIFALVLLGIGVKLLWQAVRH
jgi:uncharacterized membrane protein YfcA